MTEISLGTQKRYRYGQQKKQIYWKRNMINRLTGRRMKDRRLPCTVHIRLCNYFHRCDVLGQAQIPSVWRYGAYRTYCISSRYVILEVGTLFTLLHLTVLLFTNSKRFILSLLLITLSPPSDYFHASDSMFLIHWHCASVHVLLHFFVIMIMTSLELSTLLQCFDADHWTTGQEGMKQYILLQQFHRNFTFEGAGLTRITPEKPAG